MSLAQTLKENPSAAAVSSEDGATPLMAQYLAIKAQHPDCLVFFRLGDFYEMFFEDAVKASRALDITLTRRGQMNGQDIPMCGVPFHSYENYLARLIRKGFHVALCEQTEDPAAAKKRGAKSIVTREVVRIVTPGTVTEDSLLEARSANILSCLVQVGDEMAVAWMDLATGQPFAEAMAPEQVAACLARLSPSEIVLAERVVQNPDLFEGLAPWRDQLTVQPSSRHDSENARRRLMAIYRVQDLGVFGGFSRATATALGVLLDYVALTQKCDLSHILKPQLVSHAPYMAMDPATRRNLELTRTLAGERQGSLLATIDRTVTSAGARLLAARLMAPLMQPEAINERLDALTFFATRERLRHEVRLELHHTPDLERSLARLSLGRGGPRDLAAVREALGRAQKIRSALLALAPDERPAEIAQACRDLGEHSQLYDRLEAALAPELPLLARDGGFIARGFSPPLDELVMLRDDSRRMIAGLQSGYVQAAGVPTLKIKHNQVIGYYIEVSPTHADKLMAQKELFIHRQTLAGAVRFTTVELSELERKILEAAGKALAMELQLFADLVKEVEVRLADLRLTAGALALLDVAAGLAELAVTQNYTRPVVDDSLTFLIKGGRHPVVEKALKESLDPKPFVGNDCDLGSGQRLWLLTGPNMAGKSTFLRQNALIALLAQTGSFVPASAAHIGVVNRLFSRVGAADDLARGQSTFMVEMVETAAILNQADERSLVILDEIGRGTATYDGLSIAWATIEYLHECNRCRTIFATHYHELTQLAGTLAALTCATMRIKEWEKEVIFLHEVMAGVADRSYGIHVAQMAGLPENVIHRAQNILESLENGKASGSKRLERIDSLPLFSALSPAPPPKKTKTALIEAVENVQPDEMTPKQALEALYILKKLVDV